jgi:mRNA interferase RelE/StbE
MKRRVAIRWTATAREGLKRLPKKVARGLWEKVGQLRDCDPREPGKPLTGPLQGFYRLAYSRYRAVYSVQVEKAPGETAVFFTVHCVVVGLRREGDRKDVYRLAQRLVDLGIIEANPDPGKGRDQERR